jgi:hypothetical protein
MPSVDAVPKMTVVGNPFWCVNLDHLSKLMLPIRRNFRENKRTF